MASPRPSRLGSARILRELRAAARGDRAALTLAVDQMRTLAMSPRYWEKYLRLLRSPLARLVDLLVIKQGERIAHQKGWKKLGGGRRPPSPSEGRGGSLRASPKTGLRGQGPRSKRRPRRPRAAPSPEQPLLFEF